MSSFQFFHKPSKSIEDTLKELKSKDASHWEEEGEKMVLRLFHFAAQTVPAYKKFLEDKLIDTEAIDSMEVFRNVPLIDKDSYLRKHDYPDLFPNRDISSSTTFAATSGSTGEPFYFPRGEEQDWQYEYGAELFLKNQFEIGKKKTLGIIGFGMGIWIGGVFTYKTLNRIAEKGYKLSLAPVGPNIELFLKVVKKFGHMYDQLLLMGYPPLIKDILDEANDYGVDWKKYDIKILTAAEGFSERFRDYLVKKAAIKNPSKDVINIYGTVEMGTMAHETAISSIIRRIAVKHEALYKRIFSDAHRLPTLAQYHPYLAYFEEVNGEVVGSGFGSSIPLVRYRFFDKGGVIPFDDMMRRLTDARVDIKQAMRQEGIVDLTLKLPFVYVYERSDNTIVVRGANIYAEEVRLALQHNSLESHITGKCTLEKREDKESNHYFTIHVELKKHEKVSQALAKGICDIVVAHLNKTNSEFNDQYRSVPQKITPRVALWPYQHPEYFATGSKHKWVR